MELFEIGCDPLGGSRRRIGMWAHDASRWLALSMAILIAMSALLHDRHTPKRLPLMGTAMSSRTPTPSLKPNIAISSPAAKTERGTMVVAMFRHPDTPSASRYPRRTSSAQYETSLPPLHHLPSHCRVTCRSGCGPPRSPRSLKRAPPSRFVRFTISNLRSRGHENQRAQCIYLHASFWHPPRSVRPPVPPYPWSL